jgi:hypothetical protein
MATYPYWDAFNRYKVAGYAGRETVFAAILRHPNGYWRWRCYGNALQCPRRDKYEGYGYSYTLADAKTAAQAHCQSIHHIVPPP